MSNAFETFAVCVVIVLTVSTCVYLFLSWYLPDSEQVIERAPSAPVMALEDWSLIDAQAFKAFLKTDTGKKLLTRSQAMVASSCISSCSDSMHTAHSAGTGHGMNEFLKWQLSLASDSMLEKLSQPTGAQVDNTSNSDGQAALLARYSP